MSGVDFIKEPMTIEKKSMEIIAPYLPGSLSAEEIKIYSRIIHAAGDPGYAEIIDIHPDAIEAGLQSLGNGASIFSDVEMVRTGINKRILASFGGSVNCLINDEGVAVAAKESGITRSMAAMRQFGKQLRGQVIAIGNAPTALFEVLRLAAEENVRPALIVGIPVGFVGAAESKELLRTSGIPYITVRGTKGGSPIAAATVNALLYILSNNRR